MYEDFLEEFVYNTAKEIAMRLFGRFVSKRSRWTTGNAGRSQQSREMAMLEEQGKELLRADEGALVDEATLTEEQRSEQELNQLLRESLEKQKKKLEERDREELERRKEYDGINEGLSPLHFHFTLFLFLVVLTALNLPSAITWAKNFDHSRRLIDATTVPAITSIAALAVIWQMTTPRMLARGYQALSMVFYGMAMVTIIYCLDSVFLLNNIIATIFVLVALQQVFAPKMIITPPEPRARKAEEEEGDATMEEETPQEQKDK